MPDEVSRPDVIYALRDPRDGAIRYIGVTNDRERRLSEHRQECRSENHYRGKWWRKCVAHPGKPLPPEHREKIAAGVRAFCAAKKRKPVSDETRERMSAVHKARGMPAEQREKMLAGLRAYYADHKGKTP